MTQSWQRIARDQGVYFSQLLILFLLMLSIGCSRTPVTVTLSPTSGVISVGLSQQFVVLGHYSNGKVLPLKDVSWSVTKTDVITVTDQGLVTAHTAGTAQVVAAVDGFTVLATVTVTPLAVQSISFDLPAATIALGNTLTLIPTVHYNDGSSLRLEHGDQAPNSEYHTLWRSFDDAIASVDENGVVTVRQPSGMAVISMNLGDVSAEVKVSAAPPVLSQLSVRFNQNGRSVADTETLWLHPGETAPLHVQGTSSTGQSLTPSTISWRSEDPSIVTISPAGVVTAVGEGETRVSVSAGGVDGGVVVSVGD